MAKFTRSNNAILPDGDRVWDDDQSMDYHRITHAQNAVDPQDYITKAQTFPRITETDAISGVYYIYVNWNTGTTDVEAVGGGTIGTPFKTPHLAFEWLSDYSIDSDVIVQIQCAAGQYLFTEQLKINHPNGANIEIIGSYYEGALDPGLTTTEGGSLRDKTVGFATSSMDKIPPAGDFALIGNATGNNGMIFNGGYEVLAGAGGNTFDVRFRAPTIPDTSPLEATASAGRSGDIVFLETVFLFDISGTFGGTAIFIDDNNSLGLIDKVVIRTVEGVNEDTGNGFWIRFGATVQLGQHVVFSGWNVGIWVNYSASINHVAHGFAACSNCVYGIWGEFSSSLDVPQMSFTNCIVGIEAKDTTSVYAYECMIANNYKGIELANGSTCQAALSKVKYNDFAAYLWHGSSLRIGPSSGTPWTSNHTQVLHMRYGCTCHMYDTNLDGSPSASHIRMFFNNTLRLIRLDGTDDISVNWVGNSTVITRNAWESYSSYGNLAAAAGKAAGGDWISYAEGVV